jgi:ribosomal protein L31E
MKIFSFLASFFFVSFVLSSSINFFNLDKSKLRKNYSELKLCNLFDNVKIVSLNELRDTLNILAEIGNNESVDTSRFNKELKNDIIHLLNLICDKLSQAGISDTLAISIVQGIKKFNFEVLVDLIPDPILLCDIVKLNDKVLWYFEFYDDHIETYNVLNEKLFSRIKFLKLESIIGTERAQRAMKEKKQFLNKELDVDTLLQLRKNFLDINIYALFDVPVRYLAEFSNIIKKLREVKREKAYVRSNMLNDTTKFGILFNLELICDELCDAGLPNDQQLLIIESIKKFQFEFMNEYVPKFISKKYVSALSSGFSTYMFHFKDFCHINTLQNQNLISNVEAVRDKKENDPVPVRLNDQIDGFDSLSRSVNDLPSKSLKDSNEERESAPSSFVPLVFSPSPDPINGDKLQLRKNYMNGHICSLFDNVKIVSFNNLCNALKLLAEIGNEETIDSSQFRNKSKNDIIHLLDLICDKLSQARISGEREIFIVEGIKNYHFEILVDLIPNPILLRDVTELNKEVIDYLKFFEAHFLEIYKSKNEKLFSRIKFLELESIIGSERAEKAMREKKQFLNKELDKKTLLQLQENYLDINLYTLFDNVDAYCLAEFTNIVEYLWKVEREKSFDRSNMHNDRIKDEILFNLRMICERLCDTGLADSQQSVIIKNIKNFQFEFLKDFIPQFISKTYFSALSSAVSYYLFHFKEFCPDNYLQDRNLVSKVQAWKDKLENGPVRANGQNNQSETLSRPVNVQSPKNTRHSNVQTEDFRGKFKYPSEPAKSIYDAQKLATLTTNYATEVKWVNPSLKPLPIYTSGWEKPSIDKNKVITLVGLDKDFPFNLKNRKPSSLNDLYMRLGSHMILNNGDGEVIAKIKLEIRDRMKNIIELLDYSAKEEKLLVNALMELKFQPLDELFGLSKKFVDPQSLYDENISTLFVELKALFRSVHSLIINRNLTFKEIPERKIPNRPAKGIKESNRSPLEKAFDEFMQEYVAQNVSIFEKIYAEKEERLLLELESKSKLPQSEEEAQELNSKELETMETEENQTLSSICDAADEADTQNETYEVDYSQNSDYFYDTNEDFLSSKEVYQAGIFEYLDYDDTNDITTNN